jgi:hypothetical protein
MMNNKIKLFAVGLLSGCLLMLTASSFAASIKEYILVKAEYPIYVNEEAYTAQDQPILNYEGHTYIPLRSIGELLGASVAWDERLRQVEINYGEDIIKENQAFRNITVMGTNGNYKCNR